MNMNYRIIWLLLWGTVLLFAASANAYEFPPYQGLTLKISGNISESYSNNVTFESKEEDRVEDFTTMMNFGLDFKYKGKTRSFGFSGDLRRELFKTSSEASNPSENARLSFSNSFSKYDRVSFSNVFKHTQTPIKTDVCTQYYTELGLPSSEVESKCSEFSEEFGRFKGRFDSYSNSMNLAYDKTVSEFVRIASSYSFGQNWSKEEDTNDSDYHSVRLKVSYQYSRPTTFSLSYNYHIGIYDEREDIARQSITAGIKQYITKRIYFNGEIGTDRTISGIGDDNIKANASLHGQLDNKTSASIAYVQGTRITQNTDDTFENWQISAYLSRLIFTDLDSSFSVFYGQGEFSSTSITDKFLGYDFSLAYELWRSKRGAYLSGELGYAYSNVDSTVETRNYKRNSVTSSLTAAF